MYMYMCVYEQHTVFGYRLLPLITCTDLRIEVKALERVDDARVLGDVVVHDLMKTVIKRRRLNHSLVVRVIQALQQSVRVHASDWTAANKEPKINVTISAGKPRPHHILQAPRIGSQ